MSAAWVGFIFTPGKKLLPRGSVIKSIHHYSAATIQKSKQEFNNQFQQILKRRKVGLATKYL